MQPDRANVGVAVMDQPRLLSGVGIAAASERGYHGGHRRMPPAATPAMTMMAAITNIS
jgi:hypothetical protein